MTEAIVLRDTADGPVFQTPSASAWHREIAEANTILKVEVGSTMHGVSDPSTGDDIDEMGICIEPPEVALGIKGNDSRLFDQYEFRTQPQGARSGPGDVDRIIYGLRKWMRMAAQGQPTQLMPLFAQQEMIRTIDPLGQELRDNAEMFLSKQAGDRFLGYLNQQIKRYVTGGDGYNVVRPELVEQYGWDTKAGYHALRIAIQGTQLMRNHFIELPMYEPTREWLLAVRQGVYSKQQVLEYLKFHTDDLKEWQARSALPDTPDYRALSSWCARLYLTHWETHGKTPAALP